MTSTHIVHGSHIFRCLDTDNAEKLQRRNPADRTAPRRREGRKKDKSVALVCGVPISPRSRRRSGTRQTQNLTTQRAEIARLQNQSSGTRAKSPAHTPAQLQETGVAEVLGGHPVLEQDRRHGGRGLLHAEHPGYLWGTGRGRGTYRKCSGERAGVRQPRPRGNFRARFRVLNIPRVGPGVHPKLQRYARFGPAVFCDRRKSFFHWNRHTAATLCLSINTDAHIKKNGSKRAILPSAGSAEQTRNLFTTSYHLSNEPVFSHTTTIPLSKICVYRMRWWVLD